MTIRSCADEEGGLGESPPPPPGNFLDPRMQSALHEYVKLPLRIRLGHKQDVHYVIVLIIQYQ